MPPIGGMGLVVESSKCSARKSWMSSIRRPASVSCSVGSARGSRASISSTCRQLVGVDVRVLDPVHVLDEAVAGELLEHQPERGVLRHVRRHADRRVAGALVVDQVQLVVEHERVDPAVAGGDRVARADARLAVVGVRDPRAHQRGPVERQVTQLAHEMRQLIEAGVLAVEVRGEVLERVPVGARAEVAGLEAAALRTSRAWPMRPTSCSRTPRAARACARR